jgi:hypothetical protein
LIRECEADETGIKKTRRSLRFANKQNKPIKSSAKEAFKRQRRAPRTTTNPEMYGSGSAQVLVGRRWYDHIQDMSSGNAIAMQASNALAERLPKQRRARRQLVSGDVGAFT